MTMSEHFKFFENRKCEYYPCHELAAGQEFNCLFCYCPLYALGDQCGGNFVYTAKGVKNCSYCNIPHIRENYDRIIDRLEGIIEMTKKL